MVFFRLHFVANDFALREQGVSRVNDAGVVAGEAACVEKRKSARKFADIRSTGPAAANGGNFGRRQRCVAAETVVGIAATVAVARPCIRR
jgi:hypothetical protein